MWQESLGLPGPDATMMMVDGKVMWYECDFVLSHGLRAIRSRNSPYRVLQSSLHCNPPKFASPLTRMPCAFTITLFLDEEPNSNIHRFTESQGHLCWSNTEAIWWLGLVSCASLSIQIWLFNCELTEYVGL